MNIKTILLVAAAYLMTVASSRAALTYLDTGAEYIGPSGLYVIDQNGNPSPFAGVSRTVETTLVVDPDNLTARYSGSVSAATASLSYTTGTTSQQVGTINQFPNPPQPVYADGYSTITLSVTTDAFTFDTGVKNITWNGSAYVIPEQSLATIQATFSMTFSVTSGGQTTTITDSWTDSLLFYTTGALDLSDYPTTAALGLRTEDFAEYFTNSAPNGFTASFTFVPEPSSAVLAVLGTVVLVRRRRR